jgi:hypothetical protein
MVKHNYIMKAMPIYPIQILLLVLQYNRHLLQGKYLHGSETNIYALKTSKNGSFSICSQFGLGFIL